MSVSRSLLFLVLAAGWGCGGATFDEARESSYGRAVEASVEEEWADAAREAHAYLRTATPEDERWDRAIMLMARGLERVGLSHAAALWYLEVAEARRNVELVDDAVAGLERIVWSGPHDDQTLVAGFLGRAEITDLSPELAAFVAYEQGLDSVRQGFDDWADQRFASIRRGTPYAKRGRYAQAVRALATGKRREGRRALEALLRERRMPKDLAADVRLAIARLSLEEGKYAEAVRHYERVRDLAPEQPELLLEMAWAHFYGGDSRRAMGLLVALDAPLYRGLIAPERYLLEALSLRRLCQFEPARISAARLQERHGEALLELHAGVAPGDSESIRRAAMRRGIARDAHGFVRRLERERDLADDLSGSLGDALAAELTARYGRALANARRREEAALAVEVDRLADELVAAEDGVRLILHELSVALMRGRRRPEGPDERPAADLTVIGNRVVYQFQREFWTDELDDLVVVIPDRCLE
jgi:hypothetical protein